MRKHRGGYDIRLAGRPGRDIQAAPPPPRLLLPLASRRFAFRQPQAPEGSRVQAGAVLARDGSQFDLPLLAPRGGTVRWQAQAGHVVLENLDPAPADSLASPPHAPAAAGSDDARRRTLVEMGAWAYFSDAYRGLLPDPAGTPDAVIVSTLRLEPYQARGDVQMRGSLLGFIRGLEHLQALLRYQPIYLVLPSIRSDFARQVREQLRGHAWIRLTDVPLLYPHDSAALTARRLGLRRSQNVWALGADGVLAIDSVLTFGRPAVSRVICLAGPGVKEPTHLSVPFGYPIEQLTAGRLIDQSVRVINGGALNGRDVAATGQLGLDVECQGLTVVPELVHREAFGWTRPGADRQSYSNAFVSRLLKPFDERLTTGLRGEHRPCISCTFCEEVCPMGLMPHLIHKLLYANLLDEVEKARPDLCTDCGLCAFVCPSKIELRQEMNDACRRIAQELHEPEVKA